MKELALVLRPGSPEADLDGQRFIKKVCPGKGTSKGASGSPGDPWSVKSAPESVLLGNNRTGLSHPCTCQSLAVGHSRTTGPPRLSEVCCLRSSL